MRYDILIDTLQAVSDLPEKGVSRTPTTIPPRGIESPGDV